MGKGFFQPQFSRVPTGWQLIPLKRVMRVTSGKEVEAEVSVSENAVPVYGSGLTPFKYTDRAICNEPVIIFGRKGTLGQPFIVRSPFWVVDTAYMATARTNTTLLYLNYILKVFDWQPFITNTAKPSLVANDILAEKVPLPEMPEQSVILNYLKSITTEIDSVGKKLRHQVELLERYRRELIAHTVTRGLNLGVPMRDSGIEWLGKIPHHWETLRIGSLYDERSIKVSDQDFPPLSVTMKGILPQLETVAKTNDGDNRKLIRKGDFVINSRSDRRGACGIADRDGSCSLINTVLRPQQSIHNPFFNYLFRSSIFADEFYKWGHGIVDDLWTTKWADMKVIQVPVPPVAEQCEIAIFLNTKTIEIGSAISSINKQIELLGKYRKQVINDAVTGKIRVGGEA
ncbi:restriction endonuclease subunit S [Actinotignum sp. GS-2025c]|uniref:restriction endonuclease subunit S n=1 Tax=Actinotignum sp. GS-2025c TaxID=3427276 RepID=UPI003F448041